MGEIRNAAPGNVASSGGANTINKNLGAELMGKMSFGMNTDEELDDSDTVVEDGSKTEVEEEEEDVSDQEKETSTDQAHFII